MLGVTFQRKPGSRLQVLCLGAHSDDIEIGCGGTILRLLRDRADLSIHWIVFGADEQRRQEALASAEQFLGEAEEKRVRVLGFRNSFFPSHTAEIKEHFEELKREIDPDIIFTHFRYDAHQDHRLIGELTWNTFRNHLILEYEIPKYDGDLGAPSFFVQLDEQLCRKKVHLIMDHFVSQQGRQWFSEDTFLALLRMRGVESNSPGRYAEAFYSRKMVT